MIRKEFSNLVIKNIGPYIRLFFYIKSYFVILLLLNHTLYNLPQKTQNICLKYK